MNSNRFSPSSISELRNQATNLATSHQRYADAIGSEIALIDRLLAHHLAGVPDVQHELIAVGRRLASLLETGGPR
jgi:hypothetical protein